MSFVPQIAGQRVSLVKGLADCCSSVVVKMRYLYAVLLINILGLNK